MMAITHHFIVHFAAHRIKLKDFSDKYALLGDDLLICDDALYESYTQVIKIAKMELNETKTFKSKRLFEFAKRFYYNGVEISPFPLGSLLSAQGQPSAMAIAIDNAIAKS